MIRSGHIKTNELQLLLNNIKNSPSKKKSPEKKKSPKKNIVKMYNNTSYPEKLVKKCYSN